MFEFLPHRHHPGRWAQNSTLRRMLSSIQVSEELHRSRKSMPGFGPLPAQRRVWVRRSQLRVRAGLWRLSVLVGLRGGGLPPVTLSSSPVSFRDLDPSGGGTGRHSLLSGRSACTEWSRSPSSIVFSLGEAGLPAGCAPVAWQPADAVEPQSLSWKLPSSLPLLKLFGRRFLVESL